MRSFTALRKEDFAAETLYITARGWPLADPLGPSGFDVAQHSFSEPMGTPILLNENLSGSTCLLFNFVLSLMMNRIKSIILNDFSKVVCIGFLHAFEGPSLGAVQLCRFVGHFCRKSMDLKALKGYLAHEETPTLGLP